MDEHIPIAVSRGLRRRGVDIVTAQEAGLAGADDGALFDFAAASGAVVVTCDSDFLVEASRRQSTRIDFAGVVFVPRSKLKIGRMIDDLELIASALDPAEIRNQIQHLPL